MGTLAEVSFVETGALRDLNRWRQPSEVLSRNRAVIGGSCVRVADRDRKKLEEFFAGSWPGARVMMVGVAKESTETTASSESDVALYLNRF